MIELRHILGGLRGGEHLLLGIILKHRDQGRPVRDDWINFLVVPLSGLGAKLHQFKLTLDWSCSLIQIFIAEGLIT